MKFQMQFKDGVQQVLGHPSKHKPWRVLGLWLQISSGLQCMRVGLEQVLLVGQCVFELKS